MPKLAPKPRQTVLSSAAMSTEVRPTPFHSVPPPHHRSNQSPSSILKGCAEVGLSLCRWGR